MAQSPDKAEETTEEYAKAWATVLDLIRAGQSWSGKERNCVFLNTGTPTFADASAVTGLDFPDDGRGLAAVDWDADGDLDLWFTNRTGPRTRFLLNNCENNDRYISFRLIAEGANRDAIGAEVELHLDGQGATRHVRTLKAGSGFISQSSKWVHFGLPEGADLSHVTVRWPGGPAQDFNDISLGARWTLTESNHSSARWERPGGTISLAEGALPASPEMVSARIPIIAPLPLLGLSSELSDGSEESIEVTSEGGLLITLWADWCANCKRELLEIAEAEEALKSAGIRILALNAEGLKNSAATDAYLDKISWPFERADAGESLLGILATVQRTLLTRSKPEVIPTSYLLDHQGRLQFIYRGAISPERVLEDAQLFSGTPTERRELFAAYDGWWSTETVPTRYRNMAINLRKAGHSELAGEYLKGITLKAAKEDVPETAVNKIFGVEVNTGTELLKEGNISAATKAFARAVELKPESAQANKLLGVCLQKQGKDTEALPYLQVAASRDPSDAETQNDLGLSLVNLARLKEAGVAFTEAVKLDPNLAKAQLNLGVYLAQSGKLSEAITHVTKATALDPSYIEAWITAAQIYSAQGNSSEALAKASRASDIDGENADALFIRTASLVQLGRINEAQALYPQLRALSPAKADSLRASLGR